jgi:hypothetical protein
MIHRLLHLQKQPSENTCAITAFAMAMGMNVKELMTYFPDGDQVFWPELERHNCRGHHVQELVDFAVENEFAVTEIHANPVFSHHDPVVGGVTKPIFTEEKLVERITKYMSNNWGVITGVKGFNAGHAVAWDGESVYDPCGEISKDATLNIQSFYIFKYLGHNLQWHET